MFISCGIILFAIALLLGFLLWLVRNSRAQEGRLRSITSSPAAASDTTGQLLVPLRHSCLDCPSHLVQSQNVR